MILQILSENGEGIYECPITVENEKDAQAALADVRANGVNALVPKKEYETAAAN